MPDSDSNNVKAAGRWVSGQFFAYLLSFVFGVGGTLAAIKAGIIEVGTDINELRDEVVAGFGTMEKEFKGIRSGIGKLSDDLSSRNALEVARARTEIVGAIKQDLNTAQASIGTAVKAARVELVAKHNVAFEKIESIKPYVKQMSEGSKKEILIAQASGYDELERRIDSLLADIDAVRSAFVAELSLLVKDGDDAIREKNLSKVGRWIASSGYFIRSLVIPTEPGWLRDVSVVKKDLREAMERFEKETDKEKKLAHARRVMVIVETVRDLAEGGQLQ